jgi:hypothetical protein
MFATELQQVWSPIWRRLRGDLASSRRLRDSLRTREILLLTKRLQGEHRAFFNASFDTRLAEARARVDARLAQARADAQAHLVQAEKKLSKAFAARVEDSLPTFGSGSQWWVDPIIGLWGQVNFTRWLFLAVQGDVGGFAAGSLFAANVSASLGVNLTRNIFLESGYRFFYMDRPAGF